MPFMVDMPALDAEGRAFLGFRPTQWPDLDDRPWSHVYFYLHRSMGENDRTVWDDLKNARNVSARGIDFADLDGAFDGRFALVVDDKRRDYGERRFNMLIELHGVVLNVTFTPRLPKYRIISARLASRKERRAYDAQRQIQ